jgi:protein TonB
MRSLFPRAAKRLLRSFLGLAFLLSLALHLLLLPLFGLKAQAQAKSETSEPATVTIVRPKPTPLPPPPPTPLPSPQSTPRPVSASVASAAPKAKAIAGRPAHPGATLGDLRNVLPKNGAGDGIGAPSPAGPAIAQSGAPASPLRAVAPPTATPKPACPTPNAEAALKGQAAEPEYPAAAREQGAAGTTEVKVTLDSTGDPTDVAVYRSSGFAALDRAALEAARASRYTAAVVDCAKVAGEYLFTVEFDGQ